MNKILLILIISLGLFLRTYKLGSFPSGFLWDEAALGYNAYSILHTGKDEYGNRFPLIFKSFGDYKPGIYVYATIPFIAVFGLNEFATRLPSAIVGTLAVFLLYLLVKKKSSNENLALISAFILTINPWHLNFSRGSWELNVMLTELLGMLVYLDYFLVDKKKVYGVLSFVFFVLSLLTYQSAKIISPILFFTYLFITQPKNQWFTKRNVTLGLTIVSVFVTFTLITFVGGIGGRLKVMSLFSYPRSPEETSLILNQDNQNQTVYSLFHSTPVYFTRLVLGRYFNHFSARFLFIDGDWQNPRLGVVYHGLFYLVDIVFMILGFWTIIKRRLQPLDRFMLFWLLLAPIPSALSRDSVSSVRSFTMVIPLVYLVSNGIAYFVSGIKYHVSRIKYPISLRFRSISLRRLYLSAAISPKWLYLISSISLVVIYGFSFLRFADLYFLHNPRLVAKDRLYGYRQAIEAVIDKGNDKNHIIFSPKFGQPYIFYLFYSAYDPAKYQQQALLKENPYGDVGNVERLDNIDFRQIYWPQDRGMQNSLLVGTDEELPLKDIIGEPDRFVVDREIRYPDGKVAFRVVETY